MITALFYLGFAINNIAYALNEEEEEQKSIETKSILLIITFFMDLSLLIKIMFL